MGKPSFSDGKSPFQMGVFYAALSYCIWGVLPIYWKWLEDVSAAEILVNRILWSFFFSLSLVLVQRKGRELLNVSKQFFANKKQALFTISASVLLSFNWFIFIWAVNSDHVTETSLGYYINPLVSMMLGVIFLKEKLNILQKISFALAAIGVLILTFGHGSFPYVALGLAVTFAFYGLFKKFVKLDAAIGLTIETFFVTPIAFLYLMYLGLTGEGGMLEYSIGTNLLLMGAGVVTALPLLLFALGTQRIPLTMIGILQYISPTITLFLGIFLFHEPFSSIQFIAFLFIWTALALFTVSNFKWVTVSRRKKDLTT